MNRGGHGLCRCGATIALTGDAQRCDPVVGDLLKMIRARLVNDETLVPAPGRFPAFSTVSLPVLLTLVRRLHAYVRGAWLPDPSRAVTADPDRALTVVAQALCRFGEGIESMQAVLAGSETPIPVSATSKGYGWYTRGTPRLNLIGDLDFLGHAMRASLNDQRCPASTRGPGEGGRWLEVEQALASTRHDVERVSQLINLKLLQRRSWLHRGRWRRIVLEREILGLRPSAAVGLDTEAAADLAGLTPRLFLRLARSPIYRVNHVASSGGAFAAEDVEVFAAKLLRLVDIPLRCHGHATQLTLGRVLQSKSQLYYSAAIVRAVQAAESCGVHLQPDGSN